MRARRARQERESVCGVLCGCFVGTLWVLCGYFRLAGTGADEMEEEAAEEEGIHRGYTVGK